MMVRAVEDAMSTSEYDELEFCVSSLRLQGGSNVLDGVSLRRQAGKCQEDDPR